MKPIIIGAGLAGMTVALSLSPMPVILLSPRKLGEECASAWAQGGIAAAVGSDDSPGLHAVDTMSAGADLCDPAIVKSVTEEGANIIQNLVDRGVVFDRDEKGKLLLGLEAAHSQRRIVHAADSTGASIVKALIAAVCSTPSIEVIEDATATELLTRNGDIFGVAFEYGGDMLALPTQHVVLATGGTGALWQQTSNPLGSWGRGLALAARAGAVLTDLEFMQFHPTCIDIGRDPMPLASEALRGEGCTLIDDTGDRFCDELQPRDVVARAIWTQRINGRKTFLDARKALSTDFAKRFPAIYATCTSAGINPSTTPIPIAPGAHYHMGGVATDLHGRTNVRGLWACGEVASTGLHGANRLASNSLLEAAAFGNRVADSIKVHNSKSSGPVGKNNIARHEKKAINSAIIRNIMSRHVGVVRQAEGLQSVVTELAPMAMDSDMALVAFLISLSALRREESRGSHWRSDFPAVSPNWKKRQIIKLDDVKHMFIKQTERRAKRR